VLFLGSHPGSGLRPELPFQRIKIVVKRMTDGESRSFSVFLEDNFNVIIAAFFKTKTSLKIQ